MATPLGSRVNAARKAQSKRFGDRLRKLATDFPRQVTDLQRALFDAAASGTIIQTTVDRGRLAYGWNASIGEPSATVPAVADSYPDKDAIVAAAQAVAASAPAFGKLWLSNNVEYAAVLEQGGFEPPDPGPSKDPRPGRTGNLYVQGGFSTGAPEGMLVAGLRKAELVLSEYEKAARVLKKGDG